MLSQPVLVKKVEKCGSIVKKVLFKPSGYSKIQIVMIY